MLKLTSSQTPGASEEDCPSSLVFGPEAGGTRRPGDASILNSEQWVHGLRRTGRRGLSGVAGPSELERTQVVLGKLRVYPGIFREYDHCKGTKE